MALALGVLVSTRFDVAPQWSAPRVALLALGASFGFLVLADWVGYPGALAIIGGVYILASAVFLVIKVRSIQK